MKKLLCIILALICVISVSACADNNEPMPTADRVTAYYQSNGISRWQDAAALYLLKADLKNITVAPADEADTLLSKANTVLYVSFLDKCGYKLDVPKLDDYIAECKNILENGEGLSVMVLTACAEALEAKGVAYSYDKAAAYLESLQLENGGFPQEKSYAQSDNRSTADALTLVIFWRDKISDTCYDNLLVYIENQFTAHNLIKDGNGDENAEISAKTLQSLIQAGIGIDGDIANAMKEAFDVVFGLDGKREIKYGYRLREYDSAASETATSEVLLALACTCFGSAWK